MGGPENPLLSAHATCLESPAQKWATAYPPKELLVGRQKVVACIAYENIDSSKVSEGPSTARRAAAEEAHLRRGWSHLAVLRDAGSSTHLLFSDQGDFLIVIVFDELHWQF